MKSVLKTMVSKDFTMNYCESNFLWHERDAQTNTSVSFILKDTYIFLLSIRTMRPLVLIQSYFSDPH